MISLLYRFIESEGSKCNPPLSAREIMDVIHLVKRNLITMEPEDAIALALFWIPNLRK